jgi:seryl-tRNA synthetase
MNEEEKITISVNEEDVQNLINCYEKDIKYIKQLEQERDKYKSIVEELKKYLKEESKKDDTYFIPYLASIHKTLDKIKELEEGVNK